MGKAELKIEIDADLLAQAGASGLDLREIIEEALRTSLSTNGMAETVATPEFSPPPALNDDEKARRWAEENAEAIKAQRERIDAIGVFGEDLRTW